MIGRIMPTLALAVLFVGTVVGFVGLLDDGSDMTHAGMLIDLTAVPPIVIAQSQRAHRKAQDEIAAAHTAGYRQALEHVAAGLLDQEAAPPDGGDHIEQDDGHDRAELASPTSGSRTTRDHTPDNVRRLYAVHYDKPEQAVQ
ncbi:hypothetical protein [Streptomyces nigrescens]|uniref:hypothetical protein n=1 Tax=Streptomyces nigrescens TaxID=1920 RepID=UPI003694255B